MTSAIHPFQNTLRGLDQLIFQLELNLGRPHTLGHQESSISTVSIKNEAILEKTEEKIMEQKAITEEKQIPKHEGNQEIKTKEKTPKDNEEKKSKEKPKNPPKDKEETKASEKTKNIPKEDSNKEKKSQDKQKPDVPKVPLTQAELLQLYPNLDIRIGKIIECWKHPDSEKLYCEKIDLGYEIREIASGVQKQIPLEKMTGLVLVAANLKPKKLGGFMSNGMVMMASNPEHTIIELLKPEENTELGERVSIDGLEGITKEKAKELNPKHNMLKKCLEEMKTNGEGIACFGGMALKTSKGVIKSQTLFNSHIS